jgi:pimeloyl-ACP methyl ester carboxylesterase
MFVQSVGSGVPAVVFVHGFGCAHTDWARQLADLAAMTAVLACDLRGHGQSPGSPADCTIATMGADVARLLAERELDAAILVGHSMGCRVVLEAYARAPERIAGLVLIDGSCLGEGDPAQATQAMQSVIDSVGYLAFVEATFKAMFFGPSSETERIVARAKRLPADIGATLFPDMARWDAARMDAALDAVRVPLMVIQSTAMKGGKRVPLGLGDSSPWLELVRRRVPGARIEVVPGVGHFLQIEAATHVNALLTQFVESLALV